MTGRVGAAFQVLVAASVLVLTSLHPAMAGAVTALDCAGASSLSAIVDALRLNGIDPLVAPPGGAEPMASPVEPVDSDAAEAAAAALNLRRLEPTASGENRETMILPQRRPAPQVAAAPAPPKETIGAATSDAYRKFIADLTYIAKLRLDEPANLKRAQQLLVKSSLDALARGWLAECSEIAAKSQEFINGIEKAASQSGGPDTLKSSIDKQPIMVLDFSGWQNASLAIRKEVARDTALMASVAWRLSEIAYGRTGNEAHLAEQANKGDFTTPAPPPPPVPDAPSSTLSARAKPIMTQMLALGAHLHLSKQGSVGGDPAESALATNKDNDQCLRWAMLNLDQCLAAAHDNSERAYCLGKQGIEERADCWSWIANPSS